MRELRIRLRVTGLQAMAVHCNGDASGSRYRVITTGHWVFGIRGLVPVGLRKHGSGYERVVGSEEVKGI